jgi:hypothetical protein
MAMSLVHFVNPDTNMALYGEFCEDDTHKDDNCLKEIARQEGCGWERTYYYRVMAHICNAELALFKEESDEHGRHYAITPRGKDVLEQVAAYVEECLDRMETGTVPWKTDSGDLLIRCFGME